MNTTTTTTVTVEEEKGVWGPDWLVELIERLKQVIAKLLLKFGLKWGM